MSGQIGMDERNRIYDSSYESFGVFVRVLGGYKYYNAWLKNLMIEAQLRKAEDVGRNDPCPCGSGKKFKKCCM